MPLGMARTTRSEAASHHGRNLWSSARGRRVLRPPAPRARQPTSGRAPLAPLTCSHSHGREPPNRRSRGCISWLCGHAARLRHRNASVAGRDSSGAPAAAAEPCTVETRGKVMPTHAPLFSLCEVTRRSAAICFSSDGSNLPEASGLRIPPRAGVQWARATTAAAPHPEACLQLRALPGQATMGERLDLQVARAWLLLGGYENDRSDSIAANTEYDRAGVLVRGPGDPAGAPG